VDPEPDSTWTQSRPRPGSRQVNQAKEIFYDFWSAGGFSWSLNVLFKKFKKKKIGRFLTQILFQL
jgi:hypothetical protein